MADRGAAAFISSLPVIPAKVVISTGLLPDTSYDGRLRIVGDWPTDWTTRDSATTPDLRITAPDIANGAVSAGAFYNFSSDTTIASGHVAASPKEIGNPFSFTAAPYFGRPRVPDPFGWGPIALNPCVLSLMGEVRNDDASAATVVHFVLQGRNGFSGAWTALSDSYKILPISSDFVAISLRHIDVSVSGGLGGFPCCPKLGSQSDLRTYTAAHSTGEVSSRDQFGESSLIVQNH